MWILNEKQDPILTYFQASNLISMNFVSQSKCYWHLDIAKATRDLDDRKICFVYSNKSNSQSRFDRQTRKHVQRERDYRKTSWSRSKYDAPPAEGTSVPQEEGVILRSREIAGATRISRSTIDRVFDNSNRRRYGMGIVGRFFGYIHILFPYYEVWEIKLLPESHTILIGN